MKIWAETAVAHGITLTAALLVGLGLTAIGNTTATGPVAPSAATPQSVAAAPPDDELQSARQELEAAWDAGTASEQRKKNAVNVTLTALRKQVSDGVAQHTKDAAALASQAADLASARAAAKAKDAEIEARDAEIERLNNTLAAERRAEALRPSPALKAHPHAVTNDKGMPLGGIKR